jgi:hypothetical protein
VARWPVVIVTDQVSCLVQTPPDVSRLVSSEVHVLGRQAMGKRQVPSGPSAAGALAVPFKVVDRLLLVIGRRSATAVCMHWSLETATVRYVTRLVYFASDFWPLAMSRGMAIVARWPDPISRLQRSGPA